MPDTLPRTLTPIWTAPLAATGLGGIAATTQFVICSDRELNDTTDAWKCFSAPDGKPLWTVSTPAAGSLDYGNSPRATPVIYSDHVYLFGAHGHLTCVKLASGEVVWETNLRDEFEPDDSPKWGACSTPLIVDNRLIVNPGAKTASLAALDCKTGKTIWKSPGKPAGYGSLIAMTVRGKTQIVGHDSISLGGWDPGTGERLWTVTPEKGGDFNVPTPIVYGEQLIIVTENNGTRLYGFDDRGHLNAKPFASNRRLVPDTHTPVVAGHRLFGVWRKLYCLNLADNLAEVWTADEPSFTKYCTVVADEKKVLVIAMTGELLLIDAAADRFRVISKTKTLENETGLYSHPAFADGRIYLRGSNQLFAAAL